MEQLSPSEKAEIDILSKTARFLKKNNLSYLDSSDDHLQKLTLNMKDEDLEYEWRLHEMKDKRFVVKSSCLSCVLSSLIWTVFLSEVNITGKMIKVGIVSG